LSRDLSGKIQDGRQALRVLRITNRGVRSDLSGLQVLSVSLAEYLGISRWCDRVYSYRRLCSGVYFRPVVAGYKNLFWKDEVSVLYFRTGLIPQFITILSNAGDGPIFASDIIVYWRGGNVPYPIHRTITANEFLTINTNFDDASLFTKYDGYLSNKSGIPSNDLIENANLTGQDTKDPACFMPVFFNEDNTDIQRMNTRYRLDDTKIISEAAEAHLTYHSVHSRERIRMSFPVVATFVRLTDPDCRKIPFESDGAMKATSQDAGETLGSPPSQDAGETPGSPPSKR
jgi:hypothetical protein